MAVFWRTSWWFVFVDLPYYLDILSKQKRKCNYLRVSSFDSLHVTIRTDWNYVI